MNKLYASAVLIDNKIYAWKVGTTKWETWGHATMVIPPPVGPIKLIINEFCYDNFKEYNRIFEVLASEWFSQWGIHEQFRGFKPYEMKG